MVTAGNSGFKTNFFGITEIPQKTISNKIFSPHFYFLYGKSPWIVYAVAT
jgi:hypothetical protein